MRSDMLPGISFANSAQEKQSLLDGFLAWRATHQKSIKNDFEAFLAMSFGLQGLSEQQLFEKFNQYRTVTDDLPTYEDVRNMLKEDNIKHYYVTDKVLSMCKNIKIREPFDLAWLTSLEDGKRQFSFGNHFIRYTKDKDKITAISSIEFSPDKNLSMKNVTFFSFNLKSKYLSESLVNKKESGKDAPFISHDNHHLDAQRAFIKLVTFMELQEIQEIIVQPGAKHGVKKAPDNLMNTSPHPIRVIRVDVNWNVTVRTEGFEVGKEGPFIRWQPWGPNRSLRKPILIQPFLKKGYNLNARKLQNKNQNPGPKL